MGNLKFEKKNIMAMQKEYFKQYFQVTCGHYQYLYLDLYQKVKKQKWQRS